MTLTDYSDTTPDVSIEYDALGRPASSSTLITDHSAPITSSTFTYNPTTLALDTETISYTFPGQAPFTRVLDRSQDTLLRKWGQSFRIDFLGSGASSQHFPSKDLSGNRAKPAKISFVLLGSVLSDCFFDLPA